MLVKLSKDISFPSLNGHTVTLVEGTPVWLDVSNMIAFGEGYHFDITRDEYYLDQ